MNSSKAIACRDDLEFPKPFLVFMGDIKDSGSAKTGLGLVDWRKSWCAGQWRMAGCAVDLGLPDMSFEQALSAGVQTVVLGVAPDGGRIPDHWIPHLVEALKLGFNLAAGLHDFLCQKPELTALAAEKNLRLFDARKLPQEYSLPIGTGARRTGKRLLTVGTDCACGKKYTALVIERELQGRGINAQFCATGQTGILISGSGIAIDAVASDFVAGAVELMTPSAPTDHWYVIEGQGSLYHPSYAGVTLSLLHGAQADVFVLCHDPSRKFIDYLPDFPIPNIQECIDLHIKLGSLTNPNIRCAGISLNTFGMDTESRSRIIAKLENETGLPVTDPLAMGVQALVDEILDL